jgi:MSHA biogenesis protein MshJ
MPADPRQLLARFDRLSLRERALIALALAVLLFQGGGLLLDSAHRDLQQAQQALATQRQALADISKRQQALVRQADNTPDKRLRQRLAQLRRDLAASQARLDQLSQRLIAPEEMAALLQQMLAHQSGLELIRLETLRTRPLNDDQQKLKIPLFAHDLVLEFRGGYLDILRYLERLESLSAGIHWDGFHLETEDWPANRVRLELHTLSLSEDWIGV